MRKKLVFSLKNESGFSLVEVIIAFVLLGIVAMGIARFSYNPESSYQKNVADGLAEQQVEEARASGSKGFVGLGNANDSVSIQTQGKTVIYYCERVVDNLNFANQNSTNDINNNAYWTAAASASTADVKRVTIH